MEKANTNIQNQTPNTKYFKNKGLRLPHEKPWIQAIILFIAIFCLVFSFLPLFLTVVNSFKLEEQVRVNAFSFPVLSTIVEAAGLNFKEAWAVLSPFYFKTILVAT